MCFTCFCYTHYLGSYDLCSFPYTEAVPVRKGLNTKHVRDYYIIDSNYGVFTAYSVIHLRLSFMYNYIA